MLKLIKIKDKSLILRYMEYLIFSNIKSFLKWLLQFLNLFFYFINFLLFK